MTATEKRAALMAAADTLQQELAQIREALRPLSQVVADLVGAADSLLMASANEITAGDVKKVRRVKSNAAGDLAIEGELVAHIPGNPPAEVVEAVRQRLTAGKRACSVCRKPGHRAANCPNAHVVQEQKKAAVAARPVKRKRNMKPLSEERKAQLRATLAKARAAKKGN